jgi:AmmeMemoRadiSam system protein A
MEVMHEVRGEILLRLARSAIAGRLGLQDDYHPDEPWLREPAATFVTLTKSGELQGCIGSLEPLRPLAKDVRENAIAAALHDPRFSPLTRDEFADTRIEVSLLSPTEPLSFVDENDARTKLRPGVDGVILEYGWHRGTFLPQVWENLSEAAQFLRQLKRKAGLAADFWHPDIRLARYTVTKWKELQHEPASP